MSPKESRLSLAHSYTELKEKIILIYKVRVQIKVLYIINLLKPTQHFTFI